MDYGFLFNNHSGGNNFKRIGGDIMSNTLEKLLGVLFTLVLVAITAGLSFGFIYLVFLLAKKVFF